MAEHSGVDTTLETLSRLKINRDNKHIAALNPQSSSKETRTFLHELVDMTHIQVTPMQDGQPA